MILDHTFDGAVIGRFGAIDIAVFVETEYGIKNKRRFRNFKKFRNVPGGKNFTVTNPWRLRNRGVVGG